MSGQYARVRIWPATLRLTHWVAAGAVLVLLMTGWLLHSGLVLSERLHQLLLEELHLPAGHLLGLALLVRCFLLLRDDGVAGFDAMRPKMASWEGVKTGVRFYISFARTPMPRYYAHHPVWAPLYLVWLALLLLQLATGSLLEFAGLRGLFGWSTQPLLEWHLAPFALLAALAALHVVSVFLHDLKGDGSDVSGMINGYRTFDTGERTRPDRPTPSVSSGDLAGWTPPDRDRRG